MRTIPPIALTLTLFAAAIPAAGNEVVPPFGHPVTSAGQIVETQIMGDFNGDGYGDLAYILRGEDQRFLKVVTSRAGEFDLDAYPPQELTLDPYPLVDADLKLKGNVLLLEDLNGGTTAVFSTHRFRWDGKLQAMRLIGLDAMLYSRTFAHDGLKASWNLLTGDLVTSTMRLVKDPGPAGKAYDTVGKKRRKRPSPPTRLEESHSAEAILPYPFGN